MSTACPRTGEVDRHFARQLAPAAERALREHLPTCPACTDRYERHLRLEQVSADGASAKARLSAGLGLRVQEPRRPRWVWAGVAGAALAVGLGALFLRPPPPPPDWPEMAARGAAASRVALEVYRLRPGAPPLPSPSEMKSGDELAFAYRNAAGRKYLLVFAVDRQGQVHWYHPAWTDAATNPSAISIQASDQVHELGAAVQVSLSPGPLTINGWFTDQPLTVREVEQLLKDGAVAAESDRTLQLLEVRP